MKTKLLIFFLIFFSIFTFVSAISYFPCSGNTETSYGCVGNATNIIFGKTRDITPPTINFITPLTTVTTSTYTLEISTNEPTNCNYTMDSFINISFNSSGALSHTNSLTSLKDGTYPITISCDDLSNNLATINRNITFKYYSSGSGGQSTGGGTIITPQKNITNKILLNYSKIISDLLVYKNKTNTLKVLTYDQFGNLTNIDNLTIYSNKLDINYSYVNENIGTYLVHFTFENTTNKQINLNFKMIKGNIILMNSRNFLISQNTNQIEKSLFWFNSFTLLKKLAFLIFTALFLITIMVFTIYYRRKK